MANSRKSQQGATALFVAALASVLVTSAALSVDLGNAWARKRDVQTQVDVSALSAGHLLPATDAAKKLAAATQVAAFLNRENNQAIDQPNVSAADLLNGSDSDGEVTFPDSETMTVVTPPARVQFGLAKFFGYDHRDVQATATVKLESPLPPLGKVLPFAIPDQCPFGSGMADVSSQTKKNPKDASTFTPANGTTGNHTIAIAEPGAAEQSTPTITVRVDNIPNNNAGGYLEFRIGDGEPQKVPLTWPETTATGTSTTSQVQIGTDVTGIPGTWKVWMVTVAGNGNERYSSNFDTFVVNATLPNTEIGCSVSAGGQFGQLYSPRNNQNPDQRGLALNIAEGIDHYLYPIRQAATYDCGKKSQEPTDGSVQDIPDATRPDCILPQTGNDGPWMLQGLITGIDDTYGRLDIRREWDGDAATVNDGKTVCDPAGGQTNPTRETVEINNDVLSCFLLSESTTLSALANPLLTEASAAGLLDSKVMDSPRFMWIPVMHVPTRTTVDNNTFYKIKRFVPAFLTDESGAARKDSSDASAENGMVINGQLESLQIFMFNPLTLPKDRRAPTADYDPLMGRVVSLID